MAVYPFTSTFSSFLFLFLSLSLLLFFLFLFAQYLVSICVQLTHVLPHTPEICGSAALQITYRNIYNINKPISNIKKEERNKPNGCSVCRNTLASITLLPVGVSLPSVGGAAALCYSCSISAPDYHQPHCSSGGLEACYFLPRFARSALCSATICNPVTLQSPYDRLTIRTVCKVNRRYQSVNWRCNSIQLGLKALPKRTDHV